MRDSRVVRECVDKLSSCCLRFRTAAAAPLWSLGIFRLQSHRSLAHVGYAPVFHFSIDGLQIFLSPRSKLCARYLHQNHFLVTPATISRLLLHFVFLGKIIGTCVVTMR